MTILRVYVGTYKKYNEGNLNGEWLDLSNFSDSEEFFEACRELHEDEEDPEFMFQDFEGIKGLYSETMSEEEVQNVIDFIQAIENSHLNEDIILAYCENTGNYEATGISEAEENYAGSFDSDEEFAENMAEELGYMDDAKGWPFNCIDWGYAARDLMYDFFESNGHYFRNC